MTGRALVQRMLAFSPKIPIPKGWNKGVQSALLQAISLGRHCFVSIVARMANSPNAVDRIVAENEHLKDEVEIG